LHSIRFGRTSRTNSELALDQLHEFSSDCPDSGRLLRLPAGSSPSLLLLLLLFVRLQSQSSLNLVPVEHSNWVTIDSSLICFRSLPALKAAWFLSFAIGNFSPVAHHLSMCSWFDTSAALSFRPDFNDRTFQARILSPPEAHPSRLFRTLLSATVAIKAWTVHHYHPLRLDSGRKQVERVGVTPFPFTLVFISPSIFTRHRSNLPANQSLSLRSSRSEFHT
jgi:hypothetical protein